MKQLSQTFLLNSIFRYLLVTTVLGCTFSSRALGALGDPVGNDIPVFRTDDSGNPAFHSLHATARGDFLVVFSRVSLVARHLMGQRYSRSGRKVGSPVLLFENVDAQIVMDKHGNVTLLHAERQDSTTIALKARFFDKDLNLRRDLPLFTFNPIGDRSFGLGAVGKGGFVVAYTHAESGSMEYVYARRFSADGKSRGQAVKVSDETVQDVYSPQVNADFGGNFVVGWGRLTRIETFPNSGLSPFRHQDAAVRHFTRTGLPTTAEIVAPASDSCIPAFNGVAFDDDGDFAVVHNHPETCFGGDPIGLDDYGIINEFSNDGTLKRTTGGPYQSSPFIQIRYVFPDDLAIYGGSGNPVAELDYFSVSGPHDYGTYRFGFEEPTVPTSGPFGGGYLLDFSSDAGGNLILARTLDLDGNALPPVDPETGQPGPNHYQLIISRIEGPHGKSCFNTANQQEQLLR